MTDAIRVLLDWQAARPGTRSWQLSHHSYSGRVLALTLRDGSQVAQCVVPAAPPLPDGDMLAADVRELIEELQRKLHRSGGLPHTAAP